MWKRHLEIAEKHVALSERLVAAQKVVVAELQRDGHSNQLARRILKTYEDLLGFHRADRDRLRKELES